MSKRITYLNPPGLGPAQGLYSQAALAPGGVDTYHIAGQVAVGTDGAIVGVGDFAAQLQQTYENLGNVLKALGETYDSIIVMRTFLVGSQSIPQFMDLRKDLFPQLFTGPAYPPNTLLIIDGLVKPEFLIEVEAVAVKLHG